MLREQIFAEALNRIANRRLKARQEQERRTDEIHKKFPETVELDQQLRSVCLSLFHSVNDEHRTERISQIKKQALDADKLLRQILVNRGYPDDYLDIHYYCSECNDSGFLTDGKRCACLIHEITAITSEQMNKHSRLALCSFESFSLKYYEDLPIDEYTAMKWNYARCKQYAAEFTPGVSGNLFMSGGTGLGKTHLSLSIASVLLEKGFSVIYDSVGNLIHILEQEHFKNSESSDDTMDTLLDCDLLILDDFGTEFDTSFSRSRLYTIINTRINASKAFIVNTNLSENELQEKYGDRILSRLVSSESLFFCGKDIRLKKRQSRTHTD